MDFLNFVSLVFCFILIKSGLILCENQSFTIAFMTNSGASCPNNQDLLLYIAAPETATCIISAPKATSLFTTTTITVNANDVSEITIPTTLELAGSGVEQKGISVSCNAAVTVYGINLCYKSSDGFSVIPNSQLRNEYLAFTVNPSCSTCYSQVVVVGYLDNTDVSVCLPSSCTECQVDIDSVIYGPGSCINKTLNAYESLQIQTGGSLAGTSICSTKPVAVFSGSGRSHVNGGMADHLVMQVPPITSWGKRFVAVRVWRDGFPVFIMAGTTDTTVRISCTGATPTGTVIVNAGEIFQMSKFADEFCGIMADYPVLVVQVNGHTDPSLLPLTPFEQYSTNYSFIPPKPADARYYDHYFIYVIDESAASGLMLDGQDVQTSPSNPVPIPTTSMLAGYFTVTDNVRHVTHPYANFSGILVGLADAESYTIPHRQIWKTYQSSTQCASFSIPTTAAFTTTPLEDGSTLTDVLSTSTLMFGTTNDMPTTTTDKTALTVITTTPSKTTTTGLATTPEKTSNIDITTTPGITTTKGITTSPGVTTTEGMTTTTGTTTTEGITTGPGITDTPGITPTPDITSTVDITTTPPDITTTLGITTTPDITSTVDITTTPGITTTLDITSTVDITTTPGITTTTDKTTTGKTTTADKTTTIDISTTRQSSTSLNNASISITSPPDSFVYSDILHGGHFVDMGQGYTGYEIITEHAMMSILQCAVECRRDDLCTSFQFNIQTSTGSCFLLRVGGNTLDSMNGQIFTFEL